MKIQSRKIVNMAVCIRGNLHKKGVSNQEKVGVYRQMKNGKNGEMYGGVRSDSDDDGKVAYQALINGGYAAINAVCEGRGDSADGSYARVDAHGFYWTATETDVANAWFYNFGKNGKILNRHPDGHKDMAISVRCIKIMIH